MKYFNLLSGGGPGQVIWAITNACNAKCRFCSYPEHKGLKTKAVDYPTAQRVLDVLAERNWKIISFTGGDPLLNPNLFKIIRYAADNGFMTRSGTNGWLLDERKAELLAASGIRNFWISIDSEDPVKHEENRGLPGLFEHLRKIIPVLKNNGVRLNAAVPINKLVGDYKALLIFLHELGLDRVAFCYPMTVMEASYGGAAESELVEFTPAELRKVLEEIAAPENTIFTGGLSGRELSTAYASGDIFVFPSATETFGNVILEAMASGLPVISPRAGGASELVKEGENGLGYQPGDEIGLANLILFLVENRQVQRKMAENARKYASEQSWDLILGRLVDEYCQIIGNRQIAIGE